MRIPPCRRTAPLPILWAVAAIPLGGCAPHRAATGLPLTPASPVVAGSSSQPADAGAYQPSRLVQAETYWGRPLLAAAPGAHPDFENKLAQARAEFDARPWDIDALIWYGRRLGYLWDMRAAVDVYSRGLKRYPRAAELYRHRGHRWISLREFDRAVADLKRAAEWIEGRPDPVEEDGLPNERNIPLTTLGFNVWYHLALAHYLRGDFDAALDGWRRCAACTRGYDDNVAAVTYWTWLTLRRLGRDDEAAAALTAIREDMQIIENHAYFTLLRLFQGARDAGSVLAAVPPEKSDFAAIGYGVGMHHLLRGNRAAAEETFVRVVSGHNWPAFGFIASEVELRRLGRR